jgi:hypothetical protein
MVNNHGYVIHKTNHKRGCRHDYDIYKNNHSLTPKQVVNVVDLGYLGIEKDFPEQLSSIYLKEKRETWIYLQKKKSITSNIIKGE